MSVSMRSAVATGALLLLASFGAQGTLVTGMSGAGGFDAKVPDRGLENLNGLLEANAGPHDLTFGATGGTFAGYTGQLLLLGGTTGGATSNAVSDNNGRFFGENPNIFWDAAGDNFVIQFNKSITAFGFDWADVGDFVTGTDDGQGGTGPTPMGAPLTVCLSNSSNGLTGANLCHDIAGSGMSGDRGFAGIFDARMGASYTHVRFINNTGGFDGQAFDNFRAGLAEVVTDPPNPIPEPGGLALLGLGLLGLCRTRKS